MIANITHLKCASPQKLRALLTASHVEKQQLLETSTTAIINHGNAQDATVAFEGLLVLAYRGWAGA